MNILCQEQARPLHEGTDFYREGFAVVFTESYHQSRGYCCSERALKTRPRPRCRHCPWAKDENTAGLN